MSTSSGCRINFVYCIGRWKRQRKRLTQTVCFAIFFRYTIYISLHCFLFTVRAKVAIVWRCLVPGVQSMVIHLPCCYRRFKLDIVYNKGLYRCKYNRIVGFVLTYNIFPQGMVDPIAIYPFSNNLPAVMDYICRICSANACGVLLFS